MSRTTNILIDEKKNWRAFTQALTGDAREEYPFFLGMSLFFPLKFIFSCFLHVLSV